jgi:hypothetical protein
MKKDKSFQPNRDEVITPSSFQIPTENNGFLY